MNMIFVGIAGYLCLILGITFWHRRNGKKGNEDFLIADRNLSKWSVVMSIFASAIGGGTLMTNTSLLMNYGYVFIPFIFALPFGLFLIQFFTKKIHKLSMKEKWFTFYDMINSRFGKEAKYMIAFNQVLSLFLISVVSLIGGARIIEIISGMSYELSVMLMAVVVCLYLVVAGFSSVVKTDFIQGIFIIILFSMLAIYSLSSGGGSVFDSSNFQFNDINPISPILFCLICLFYFFGDEGTWQRIFATKSEKDVRRSINLTSIFYVSFSACLVYSSFKIKLLFPEISAGDTGFLNGLVALVPSSLVWLVAIAILSIILSTIDTYIFGACMNLNKVFLEKKDGSVNHSKLVKRTKISIPVILFLCVIFSLYIKSVVSTTFLYGSLTALNSYLVFLSLAFNIRNKWYAICPLVINGLGLITIILLKGFCSEMVMMPFVSIILGFVIAWTINKFKKES